MNILVLCHSLFVIWVECLAQNGLESSWKMLLIEWHVVCMKVVCHPVSHWYRRVEIV